jgi:ATP-dependent helicase HepA
MWRQVFNGFPPAEIRLCFRFDFVIEVCLEEAEAVLAQNQGQPNPAARSGLSRRADALFGPTVMQVWVDEEGDELPGEFVAQFLAPPYRRQPGCADYVDKNLETPLMNLLRRFAPDTFDNWAIRCERMRDKALDIVRLRPELQQKQRLAMDRARAEDQIRYAQLQTRIRSLQGIEQADEERQFQLEQAISEALHRGIHSPLIKVDVAGVVFLTKKPAPQMPPGKGGFA